jgi:hypothetical protein
VSNKEAALRIKVEENAYSLSCHQIRDNKLVQKYITDNTYLYNIFMSIAATLLTSNKEAALKIEVEENTYSLCLLCHQMEDSKVVQSD